MRILKVLVVGLLAIFTLFTGIFAAVTIAGVSTARAIKRRFFGPKFTPAGSPRKFSARPAPADVIDVTAVEVPSGSLDK
jgi:hypothetical protein